MRTLYLLTGALLLTMACKQSYEPPAIKAPNRFLVVEGVINATPGASTVILLSRTRNLQDTVVSDPERAALVQIESSGGTQYTLTESANGRYVSAPLSLNASQNYRLKIRTSNGSEYLSDFVPVKISPPIDSLSWKQADAPAKDVTVYVSTHDAGNNSRYYRWDFTETWQYRSVYETDMYLIGNYIHFTDSTNQIYNCWSTTPSTLIALGSSVKLSQDVIDKAPVAVIPQNSPKIGVRYSILVRQYVLTPEAHKFFEILQKNTEQLGTLFDPQPSQLAGNIRNINNTGEPVIGFVTASTVTEKRLFINKAEVVDWTGGLPSIDCTIAFTPQDPVDFRVWHYSDTAYSPYYFVTGGGIAIARKTCLDCRRKGGTNQKPSFW